LRDDVMTLSTIVSSRLEPLYRRKPSHKRSTQRSNFTGEIERDFGLVRRDTDNYSHFFHLK
jgi:hypothetical protein